MVSSHCIGCRTKLCLDFSPGLLVDTRQLRCPQDHENGHTPDLLGLTGCTIEPPAATMASIVVNNRDHEHEQAWTSRGRALSTHVLALTSPTGIIESGRCL